MTKSKRNQMSDFSISKWTIRRIDEVQTSEFNGTKGPLWLSYYCAQMWCLLLGGRNFELLLAIYLYKGWAIGLFNCIQKEKIDILNLHTKVILLPKLSITLSCARYSTTEAKVFLFSEVEF